MKCQYAEYNNNGKTLKRKQVEIYFASSEKHPAVCVELGYWNRRYHSVQISAKGLVALVLGRLIDEVRHAK